MRRIVRTGAILTAMLVTLPAASRADSILEAGMMDYGGPGYSRWDA